MSGDDRPAAGARQSTTPAADVDLPAAGAARLIEAQFPELRTVRIRPLGTGWDNDAYLVNEKIVFRFPRRQLAAGLIERECQVLPIVAPHLPLPIPVPTLRGQPQGSYPYPFSGYPLLPGTSAARLGWTDAERAKLAGPIGGFLAALHGIPVSQETRSWAVGQPVDGTTPPLGDRIRALRPLLERVDVEGVARLADRLPAAGPATGRTCWVHGDLYASHLLVDDGRRLCGVIDWGDVQVGSPAVDLMIAFSFLPPAAHPAFASAYGPIEAGTEASARRRAIFYGATLVECNSGTGDPALRSAGEYALRSASMSLAGIHCRA